VDNHEIAFGDDRSRLILQLGRKALHQIEQPILARSNVSAVLNISPVTNNAQPLRSHAY
jgi:hypothetical protein